MTPANYVHPVDPRLCFLGVVTFNKKPRLRFARLGSWFTGNVS